MIDSYSNLSLKEAYKESSKNIYIARHSERPDHVNGAWYQNCFDESGAYRRNDLNFPRMLPNRTNLVASYKGDPPITNTGQTLALELGNDMAGNNENIIQAYSSPTLRSIETCSYILEGLGVRETVQINVEPSLFEWLRWYEEVPPFMTMNELSAAGHNINNGYKPVLPLSSLENILFETLNGFYERSYKFMKAVENTIPNEEQGGALMVGHSATFEVCSRQLVGQEIPSMEVFSEAYTQMKYCEMKQLVNDYGTWRIVDRINLPFTFANPGRYVQPNPIP